MKISDYSASSPDVSANDQLTTSSPVRDLLTKTDPAKVAQPDPVHRGQIARPGAAASRTDSDSVETVANVPARPNSLPEHLICFSHLRWNFVYQRPQHLMSRAGQYTTVWFLEEPIWDNDLRVEVRSEGENINVVVPHIPHGTPHPEVLTYLRRTVDQLLESERITDYITWYYTPMALQFSDHLAPTYTVYDCMDELSAFLGAPRELLDQESRLIARADQVFTGGHSLYEAKQTRHPHVHAFPSSIDFAHFSSARRNQTDPTDQASIRGPRIGFSGVIDERFDVQLLRDLADRRPDWQFVILGPVVKIDPATLPHGENVHYLGMKKYGELPAYFSGWDVAVLPFALNESTRFISPTKTPEYLAAGLPAVSTPIHDVVRTYGDRNFVQVAATADAFEAAIDKALRREHPADWDAIDQFLGENSWNKTWQAMSEAIVKEK